MAKGNLRIWDWISGGSTAWGLLPAAWQATATTALSAVTAYLGYQAGGLFYALLGGAAMFAFGMAGAYYAILFNRQTSIFEGLGVDQIAPIQAGIVGDKDKADEFLIRGLTLEVQFRNHSERNIWAKIKSAHHSVAGLTNDDGGVSNMAYIIPAHGLLKIVLATLPDIRVEKDDQITGTVDIEILYGPEKDDLRYLFSYIGKPAFGLLVNKDVGTAQLSVTSPIAKYEHERI